MFFLRKAFSYVLKNQIPLSTSIQDLNFTIYDTETTGFQVATDDRMIEIGAVHMKGFDVQDKNTFQTFVNPNRAITENIAELTNISEDKVKDAPMSIDAVKKFFEWFEKNESTALVSHYVQFDVAVLKQELRRAKLSFKKPTTIDTLDVIGFLSHPGICRIWNDMQWPLEQEFMSVIPHWEMH